MTNYKLVTPKPGVSFQIAQDHLSRTNHGCFRDQKCDLPLQENPTPLGQLVAALYRDADRETHRGRREYRVEVQPDGAGEAAVTVVALPPLREAV